MYKPTYIKTENKAREAILKGVNTIYNAVKLTLGPEAGSCLMYRTYARGPRIVDGGHETAMVIEPENEFEQIVAQTFRESAIETNKKAGDGTTTTMVIAGKLINGIFSKLLETEKAYKLSSKVGVQTTKRELHLLKKQVIEKIKEGAKKLETLEELEKIAIVSLGNEEIGKIVAKIVWEVGIDGFIDVVEGYKGELETEIIRGARFAAKVGAKAFVNNPKRYEMIAENCPVLLTNHKLDNNNQLWEPFNKILEKQKNSKLVVIAPDFSESVLISMVQTTKQGTFMFPVKVPSLRTEQFEDLAIYFGATFIDKNAGKKIESVDTTDLGFVEKLIVKDTENREDAVAVGGGGTKEKRIKIADNEYKTYSPLSERIALLKEQITEERIDSHKKLLERRIASLASAVGIIRVGASTTTESLPLKMKIEDAQYSCKSALEEGYVKGGGLCLKEIAEELPESILTEALKAPYEQIQANNEAPLEIGEEIIDPAKVVRLAVENAISVAADLITVKIIVPEIRERLPEEGYKEIAQAIMTYTKFWARKEGLIKENELEMEKDLMRKYEEEDNG